MIPRSLQLVALGLLVSACQTPSATVAEPSAPALADTPAITSSEMPPSDAIAPSDAPTASPANPASPANIDPASRRISATGIGTAQLGMTLADFRATLTPEQSLVPIANVMVDFDAIALMEGDDIQYYILHLSGTPFTEADVIQGIKTDNPQYQTQDGIGAGSSIAAAVQVYGTATLGYNLENEGREYVRFENPPAMNLLFATGSAGAETAGIYPDSTAAFNETDTFREDATIQSIVLICLTADCTSAP
jgi:hypothetical protein